MKNKLFIFDVASIGCFLVGTWFSDVSDILYELLGIISFMVSILISIAGLVMKFKHYMADGKLTDDEINDLVNDAKKQFEDLEDKKNDKQ